MASRARFLHASVVVSLALGGVACGDSGAGDGGEGGRSNGTTRATGSTVDQASSTADTSATTTTVSSSGTVMPMPCVPPGIDGMVPTPGVCQGNTAVVCDTATSMTVAHACAADETCKAYTLTEHTFNLPAGDWTETGTVEWAACIPTNATPCTLGFNGMWWESQTYKPQCVDDDRSACEVPPVPIPASTGVEKQYGTTDGYVHLVACPSETVCREPLSGEIQYFNDLGCFDPAAAPCSTASSVCEGQTTVTCNVDFGYEVRNECAPSGNICMIGCDMFSGAPLARCTPPGTQHCDPAVQPTTCDTEDTYTTCSECLTFRQDCSLLVAVEETGQPFTVPGECVVGGAGPFCDYESTEGCDTLLPDVCDGNVARMCVAGLMYEVACTGGDVCQVSFDGRAGCTFPTAAPCFAEPATCSGDALHDCCPSTGMLSPFVPRWCVPGLEATLDCTLISPSATCGIVGPEAACQP